MPSKDKLTLVVPPDLTKAAKALALQEGTSVSAVVRHWLRSWVSGRIITPIEVKTVQPPLFEEDPKAKAREILTEIDRRREDEIP